MDAVVLVGGEGTRLRPLTYDTPKQMLPLVDRALITHVVAWLGRAGVTRCVLSLGYKADAFIEAFPDGRIGDVELAYAVEAEPLDTAGAIRFAAETAGVAERFVVVNADVLSDFDPAELLAFHAAQAAEASIYLTPVPDPSAFGVVVTDEAGQVEAFIEKPPAGTAPTNFINAGVYVLEPSVLKRIDSGRRVSVERETFPAIAADGGLYALSSEAYWIDTGTPAKYLAANLDILRGVRRGAELPAAPEGPRGVYVAADADVGAEIAGVAYVGAQAVVASGAEVEDAIVCESAGIAAGARIERSIVMRGAQVAGGALVADSLVGPGARVGEGARLTGMSVVRSRQEVLAGACHDGEKIGAP
jgi:mannose-1-phosphate guanylyltransferase